MQLTVNLTGLTAGQTVTLFTSSGTFGGATGTGGTAGVNPGNAAVITYTAGATGPWSFVANYTCTVANTVVTFTASQQTGAVNQANGSATITCGGQLANTITVTPPTAAINQQVQVTATCQAGGQPLQASTAAFGTTPAPTNGSLVTPTLVNCLAAGQMIAYYYCQTAITVTFTLGASQGTLVCSASQASGGITATPPSVGVGQSANISGNCVGGQSVTSSPGGVFIAVISGATYSSQNSIICSGGVFSATFVCGQSPVQVTFSSGTLTGTLGCGVAASGGLSLNPPTAGATTTVTGQCTTPGQQLTVTGTGTFSGAQINGAPIPNVTGTTVVICTSIGTLTAQFNCTTVGTANFNLGGITGVFSCTTGTAGTCPGGGIFNPLTGGCALTGGAAATIQLTANPSSLQCTGSSSVAFISVSVKDAQGQNVQDGTNVTVTADSGTFAPSQATTLGGNTQFIYSPASTSSGSVNIRATAGNAQGTTAVNVSCSSSTTAPPPVSAPVTSPPPPPAGPVTIAPPNTGDAGLAAGGHHEWQRYAAAIIVVAVMAGALAIVRSRA